MVPQPASARQALPPPGESAGWNGKFQGVGNGGWAGAISYAAMAAALGRRLRHGSTDTGHAGGSGSFALGHPEKLTDFAYRVGPRDDRARPRRSSRLLLRPPAFWYWNGCSTGGRQGLKEAQRFPDDYDGIVAGAPANNWTRLTAHQVAIVQAARSRRNRHPSGKASPRPPRRAGECDATRRRQADGVLGESVGVQVRSGRAPCKGGGRRPCLTGPKWRSHGRSTAGSISRRGGLSGV